MPNGVATPRPIDFAKDLGAQLSFSTHCHGGQPVPTSVECNRKHKIRTHVTRWTHHFGSTHCRTVFLRRMDSNQFQESRTIPSAVEKNIKGKKDFNKVAKSRCYPAIRLRRSVVAGRLFGRSIGFCRRRMGRTLPPSSRSKFVAQKRLSPTPSQSASFVEP